MGYNVWIKDEFGDMYKRVDCSNKEEAIAEILMAIKKGAEPLLTQVVPFSINVDVGSAHDPNAVTLTLRTETVRKRKKEDTNSAAKEGGPEENKGAGDKSNEPV